MDILNFYPWLKHVQRKQSVLFAHAFPYLELSVYVYNLDEDEDWEQALIDEYIEMQKEQKETEAKK